jgi:hypothetical protein
VSGERKGEQIALLRQAFFSGRSRDIKTRVRVGEYNGQEEDEDADEDRVAGSRHGEEHLS